MQIPRSERARPLAPDERRAAIVDAVIPLIRERGRDISTRQISEACGVAEGTIFRAFGDKDSIIQSAMERIVDPEPFRTTLRSLDPLLPIEEKLRLLLQLLRDRFTGVMGFMAAIGAHGPPPGLPRSNNDEWIATVEALFRDDQFGVPIPTLAYYLRLLAFGSSIPIFNTPHEFSTDELVDLLMRGVLAPTATVPPTNATTPATAATGKKA